MIQIKKSKYTHRFLARFIIEAKTPLSVGSGEKDITTDAIVATDVNGLPYIPGTSIAGVLRSMISESSEKNSFWGFQSGSKGKGSEIIFTEARILNSKSEVIDGLNTNAIKEDSLLKEYSELPIRQHARINEYGVAADQGKFDEQVVFAGTRFCFEIEVVTDGNNDQQINEVLQSILDSTFRIGSGTRCGFGEISVIELKTKTLDLQNEADLTLYLNKTSKLSDTSFWENVEKQKTDISSSTNWTKYTLTLQPDDFFLFSSGFGDDEADITPVKEQKVLWDKNHGKLSENLVLIPATSVKGAISHRLAFHYNKLNKIYADNDSISIKDHIGINNDAVTTLFGSEGKNTKDQKRGNVILSDIIEDRTTKEKLLNHITIDRFTGGILDGALFTEKTVYAKGQNYEFNILVNSAALSNKDIETALETTLIDICKGMLPLGGGVNRGNGIFSGTLEKNNTTIYKP